MTTPARVLGVLIVAVLAVVGGIMLRARARAWQETTVLVRNAPYRVAVAVTPAPPTQGTPAAVRFRVTRQNEPANLAAEGRALHLVLASKDFGDLVHTVAPAREGIGRYRLDHAFTRSGPYRVWIEVDNVEASERHDAHADLLAFADLAVGGESPAPTADLLVRTAGTTVAGYRVRLFHPPLVAGQPAELRVDVRDGAGAPVPLFQKEPFLFFFVGEGLQSFRHGHGTRLADGAAGLTHAFSAPGAYVLWMELALDTDDDVPVRTPFLLRVAPSS